MGKILIIGCGGVASVAIQKCAMCAESFSEICIASRTKSKCDELAAKLAAEKKAMADGVIAKDKALQEEIAKL